MTVFGWPNLKIELDVSEGGALGDMSAYVTELGGWSKEAIVEEITGAGASVDSWAAVGITKKAEIVLTGPYDDIATKLVAVTKAGLGETRTLQLTFDVGTAADVEIVETIITKIERNATRDALHQYSVTLRPTGAIT